jgi:hypothetical protein
MNCKGFERKMSVKIMVTVPAGYETKNVLAKASRNLHKTSGDLIFFSGGRN